MRRRSTPGGAAREGGRRKHIRALASIHPVTRARALLRPHSLRRNPCASPVWACRRSFCLRVVAMRFLPLPSGAVKVRIAISWEMHFFGMRDQTHRYGD
jgi:hypothetical protein